ncbi:MAG: hypothetical protein KDI68_14260 [Gammaproteobacteria bacterium]|nr:hypothetical protein [Gammaproteobacteria bacterium]
MEKRVDAGPAQHRPSLGARSFGLMAYMRATAGSRSELLSQLEERRPHRHLLPGSVASALRLAALLELRTARIFTRLALRFDQVPPLYAFFKTLGEEDEEQARTFLLCLYNEACCARPSPVPGIRDPEMRRLLRELRACERGVWRLSLDEALELTERLKASEVSLIFDTLMLHIHPGNEFCIARLSKTRLHAQRIPERVSRLRIEIANLD